MRTTNLKEIARQAGLAVSTVSQALADDARIAAGTRARVKKIADRLRYRPNRLVRSLQAGRTQTVGILIRPGISFTCAVINGAVDELAVHDNIALCIGIDPADPFYGVAHLLKLVDRRVDAVIMLAPAKEMIPPAMLCEVTEREIPLVLVDCNPGIDADVVCTDDVAGGTTVAEHLLALGHRRLACISGWGPPAHSTGAQRTRGFVETVRAAGGSVAVKAGGYGREQREANRAVARQLLERSDRPTAVFCGSDDIASHAYLAAADLGLAVPRDVSVVGFGNLDFGEMMAPPLTTMEQYPDRIGREAARLALARIEKAKRAGAPVTRMIPAALLERGSTAPARPDRSRTP